MRLGGVVLAALLLCTPASGDEDARNQARALADSGTAHYNLSEFREALHDFKEAYRLQHEPTFLFNIGQCYRQLDDPAASSNFYRAYRRETSDSTHQKEVDRLIAEMDRLTLERSTRQPPTGTRLPPDSPAKDDAPPTPDKTPPPAAPTVAPAPAPATPAAPEHRSIARRPWLWITVGAVVVAAGAVTLGVVLGTPARDPMPTSGHATGN